MNSCAERVEPEFLDDDLIQIIASGAAGDVVAVIKRTDEAALAGLTPQRFYDLVEAFLELHERLGRELGRRESPILFNSQVRRRAISEYSANCIHARAAAAGITK